MGGLVYAKRDRRRREIIENCGALSGFCISSDASTNYLNYHPC